MNLTSFRFQQGSQHFFQLSRPTPGLRGNELNGSQQEHGHGWHLLWLPELPRLLAGLLMPVLQLLLLPAWSWWPAKQIWLT